MAILVGKGTKAVVQGITGSQGSFHTKLMLEYGTRIVAGVTPGKGGENVHGVAVYDTIAEARAEHDFTSTVIFVPAPGALDAALEAIDANLNPIVLITEGIPIRDAMILLAEARRKGIHVVGPNTPGVITPGECKLGIMPGSSFAKGGVGVISRSGTLTYEIAEQLTKAGLGQSTCVGLGGDPLVGMSFVEVMEMLAEDEQTKAVVLIGEIGGDAEEQAAEYITKAAYPKPVIAYVAGKTAPPGKRMGHAGAIIMGRAGTAEAKIEALQSAVAKVAAVPREVVGLVKSSLKGKG